MGKKSRTKPAVVEGEIGPRQPCPCGSGKRYKACHGSADGGAVFVARPFEGLAGERDIVAMRELVPSATAPVQLKDPWAARGRDVVFCSVLPGAAPALVRADGTIWVGLQVQHNFGDASRDLAAAIELALDAEDGQIIGITENPGAGPRLQDLIDEGPFEVTVHEGFDYWLEDVDSGAAAKAALDQANAGALPTTKLSGVDAAYWTNVGTKEHLRWVMPYDEEPLLDALARLHAAGQDVLIEGSRLVGMFRAYGLLVPVWDLQVGTGAAVLEGPAERFAKDLEVALATATDLTAEERAARAGLANRQVSIR